MGAQRELEQLLHDRFDVSAADFVAALHALPAARPWAAALTEDEAHLLDGADFPEDHDALLTAATEVAGATAHLAVTALSAEEVARGLGVSASRVRQKRLAGELWAIPDGRNWLFPVLQFETGDDGAPVRQIRGLDRVLAALPADLHPVAVAGFLRTPQPTLVVGRPMTVLEWLRAGGDVEPAVAAAADTDWYLA